MPRDAVHAEVDERGAEVPVHLGRALHDPAVCAAERKSGDGGREAEQGEDADAADVFE